MKIGILKEGKIPPDSRVPLVPAQCALVREKYGIDIAIQPSPTRCYADDEYQDAGIELSEDLSECGILMGVKEVPIRQLQPNKTFFFFSHTIKKQSYNRELLRAILQNKIRLIDYEVLTDKQGQRLVAFGAFAGMVGAHNALWTWAQRTGDFQLPRMITFRDYLAARTEYKRLCIPTLRIVLTGGGRVAMGANRTLLDLGIREVAPHEFVTRKFDEAVFTRADCEDYAARKDGSGFQLRDFIDNPQLYESVFQPFQKVADIMINGIYWNSNAPAFFSAEDMVAESFRIQAIADITCDIAPVSSIPSTLRAATIDEPVFGYNPISGREISAFSAHGIDMMTVDNLPNELPRDASQSFGQQLIQHVLPELVAERSEILERATVAVDGALGSQFNYLADYVA